MADTSGFFVPPTAGRPGAVQKRVTPTGVTPQASSVSVIEGTRLTTRRLVGDTVTTGRGAAPS